MAAGEVWGGFAAPHPTTKFSYLCSAQKMRAFSPSYTNGFSSDRQEWGNNSRAYAVGVFAGVRGPQAPENLLFRPAVAALPPRLGGKRSSLEGKALQTSQLRNS